MWPNITLVLLIGTVLMSSNDGAQNKKSPDNNNKKLQTATTVGTVAGEWVGTIVVTKAREKKTIKYNVVLNLTQSDNRLNGTIGRSNTERQPVNGTINGRRIRFSAPRPDGEMLQFNLTVNDQEMVGSAKSKKDPPSDTIKVNLRRK